MVLPMESNVALSPLGRSIGRAHKFVRAWGDRELAPLGSSVTEWIVLFHIANAPEPGASQTEIARFSDMGGPALVRHIDRLEADGIVTRTRDSSDRRTIRLTLTPKGCEHLEGLRVVMARCDEQLRTMLTKEEAVVMQQALDKVFDFCLGELQRCGAELSGPPPGALSSPLAPLAPSGRTKR
jgi:MarR family transcriptional regulator for hemolysin